MCLLLHREYLSYTDRSQNYALLEESYIVLMASLAFPVTFWLGLMLWRRRKEPLILEESDPDLYARLMEKHRLRSKGDLIISRKPDKSDEHQED